MPTGYQKEEYSYQFDIDGVEIEQTVSQSFSPFSGMDIDTNAFQNTNQSLDDSNQDGRIPLGCFIFNEDNQFTNNFPDVFRGTKFKQIKQRNFIRNGSGAGVRSEWRYPSIAAPNNNYKSKPYLPLGGWGYCTYDAVLDVNKKRDPSLYTLGTLFEDSDIGQQYLLSFSQTTFDNSYFVNNNKYSVNRESDYHNTTGSAGWYAYFFDYVGTLARPQVHLDLIKYGKTDYTNIVGGEGELGAGHYFENQPGPSYTEPANRTFTDGNISGPTKDWTPLNEADEFFYRLAADSFDNLTHKGLIPTLATPYGWDYNFNNFKVWAPNIAKWVRTSEAYSYDRCLEFLATDINVSNYYLSEQDNQQGDAFSWDNSPDGTNHNQYRTLNQVIRIQDNKRINKNATITIRFKMWTDSRFNNSGEPLPMVETGLLTSDGTLSEAMRTRDVINRTNEHGYYKSHGYNPKGEFNSQRYNDDLNSTNTVNKKFSGFGAMGRFQNTTTDTWETFEYTFSLGRWFHYGSTGNARQMSFIVQAAGEKFLGRVLLDDFELIESYDFIPDVSVVKKISAGEYGTANLTKYYDKKLQPEKYKDSQVPLTAQFYFYPTYKTDETFNVSRTPMYRDFKNGLFYLYDVDWGDGSPKEFVSEPLPIDENKAPCHLYTKSGVFEVTGTMIRMKADNGGKKIIGIAHSKKFRVRINVNEGVGEDFEYFGSDGFSFLPYRNTLPIIGGHSKESSYYKTIKRSLGFLNDNTKINIPFRYDGDKLKTELALVKMENQTDSNLELLPSYTIQRTDENNNVIYNGISPIREELGNGIGDCDLTNIKYYNEPKSLYELLGFDDEEINNPNNPRYWKNIIPKDYSIFNRQGLDSEMIDTYSEQEWLNTNYYYPVLPKYDQSGRFIEVNDEVGDYIPNTYPNDKTPFPLEGAITSETDSDKSLLIHIINRTLDNNVIKDTSGNNNLGFVIMDYKPNFNTETLSPEKVKKIKIIKTSANNGAF
tara:strand:+ start:1904 stop:4873 length:2970 start_codon:yes stop_codon:yes gene_type:complete